MVVLIVSLISMVASIQFFYPSVYSAILQFYGRAAALDAFDWNTAIGREVDSLALAGDDRAWIHSVANCPTPLALGVRALKQLLHIQYELLRADISYAAGAEEQPGWGGRRRGAGKQGASCRAGQAAVRPCGEKVNGPCGRV